MATLRALAHDLRFFAKYHLVHHPARYPAPEEELGVELLPFDPDAYARALGALGPPFEVQIVGHVAYGGREHPITRVRTVRRGAVRRVLVLAGVHGNEHAGILAVPELLTHLAEHPEEHAHLELTVLAPVNPVGAARGSRYNGAGLDVNRDFRRFETREARIVRWAFDEARPDLLISLHEGPQEAAFAFCNRHVSRALGLRILDRVAAAGVALAERDYFGRALVPPGYAPMSPLGHALYRLWGATLGMAPTNVFADAHGVGEITFESSWRRAGRERIEAHVAFVRAVIAEV